MREVAWQAGSPGVDLGINDPHRVPLPSFLRAADSTANDRSGILAGDRLAAAGLALAPIHTYIHTYRGHLKKLIVKRKPRTGLKA